MATNNLLKITQSELAALLGVDRASLVRALSALRRKGAVATLRGAIKLLSQKYCSRLLPALNPSCIEQYFLGSARSSPAQLRRSAEKFLLQRLSVREAQNRKSSDDRNHLSF